jgi:peptide/nickel transport system substrate-binding protein
VTAGANSIELERNENWKAGDHPPYLDGVTYQFFPDNKEGMIAAFLTGELDVITNLLQGDYDAIKDVDPETGLALVEPAWEYEHLDLNVSGEGDGRGHPALQELEVRQAISQAIDKRALYETVFPGQPVPDINVCTNAPPGTYWRLEEGIECLEFDVDAANQLLDDAGFEDSDGDGIREADGVPLSFQHCTSNVPARTLSADFLANAMQEIGIELVPNIVDSTTVLFANWPDVAADTKCNLAHGNYDTSEFAYVLTFDLFGNYFFSYHSEQIPTDANEGNGFNYLRFSNEEMDAALDTLQDAIRPEDAVEAAYTVQEVYVQEVPEIVLYYRASTRGVAANLRNFFKNPSTSSDMWNIEDWWVEE